MDSFKVGDKVVSIYEPNKVGTVISIRKNIYPEPVYTILYEDGNMYAGYAGSFRKVKGEKNENMEGYSKN